MQTLNQVKNKKKIKKSQILTLGSFLIFLGILAVTGQHLSILRNEVYSDMSLAMSKKAEEQVEEVVIENGPEEINHTPNETERPKEETKEKPKERPIDYSIYLGVLEIPKISLKRGFFGTDSKYNNVDHNVTLVGGSSMPNVENGNLILMAHSGTATISYFEKLNKLRVGDDAYITYKGKKYHYRFKKIYEVPKNGSARIYRDFHKTTLTLITCTQDDEETQTIYIAELV